VRALASRIVEFYRRERRDLPWRRTGDPYAIWVSEIMLQQTQVSRVVERFDPFLAHFPTIDRLAEADEASVLAAWSGLGYYRRARLLHAAARHIQREHDGRIPTDPARLAELPGVGRYTAGAVACFAFGASVPIVDGNIARVLFRVFDRRAVQGDAADMRWAWETADQIVRASSGHVPIPAINEGLMELGATVCVPGEPRCSRCPLAALCAGGAAGTANQIPSPRKTTARKSVFCSTALIMDRRGRILLERRPSPGMWSLMWQAPTLEREGVRRHAGAARFAAWLGVGVSALERLARFRHQTSHRTVHFECWRVRLDASQARPISASRRWVEPGELPGIGLSSPQARMIASAFSASSPRRGSPRARTLPR